MWYKRENCKATFMKGMNKQYYDKGRLSFTSLAK